MNGKPPAPPRFWRRLHVRLAVGVFISLLGLGVGLVTWTEHTQRQTQDRITQWQNLGLAHYILERQSVPLLDAGGRPNRPLMRSLEMYVDMIHPSLDVYVLDPQGRIVEQTTGRRGPFRSHVNLAPVRSLLSKPTPALPVYGDDPLRPGLPNIISVDKIAVDGKHQGFLYIVLRGEQAQALTQSAAQARQRQSSWMVIVLALTVTGIILVAVQSRITRRLRNLALRLSRFHQIDVEPTAEADPRDDEVDQLAYAAQALESRIENQFRQLEENDRLRRELISNISHDLHTPLANVQGYVETLLLRSDQLSSGERHKYLHTSLQHCRNLGRRVQELFELSKLESGQIKPKCEAFCLAELLHDLIQSYQLQAQEHGVQLALSADTDRSARVLADIALIERVFQNLIDNALRHTPSGGRVDLAVRSQATQVSVSLRDTGEGIAAEDLPHIFERYWSHSNVAGPTSQPGTSAGLGLAIVYRILALHGSRIGVQSRPQYGTEFIFSLPPAA